ncbi:hypothetical protein EPYR_00397 [Erwinia pyrifoliae DSM 12163]|nr:hypothetical protein EPYR_00397 [Erwinia pyrifoliae DSM 12163]
MPHSPFSAKPHPASLAPRLDTSLAAFYRSLLRSEADCETGQRMAFSQRRAVFELMLRITAFSA